MEPKQDEEKANDAESMTKRKLEITTELERLKMQARDLQAERAKLREECAEWRTAYNKAEKAQYLAQEELQEARSLASLNAEELEDLRTKVKAQKVANHQLVGEVQLAKDVIELQHLLIEKYAAGFPEDDETPVGNYMTTTIGLGPINVTITTSRV